MYDNVYVGSMQMKCKLIFPNEAVFFLGEIEQNIIKHCTYKIQLKQIHCR